MQETFHLADVPLKLIETPLVLLQGVNATPGWLLNRTPPVLLPQTDQWFEWSRLEKGSNVSLVGAHSVTSHLVHAAAEFQKMIVLSRDGFTDEDLVSRAVIQFWVLMTLYERIVPSFVNIFRRVHDRPVQFRHHNSLSYHDAAFNVAGDLCSRIGVCFWWTNRHDSLPWGPERTEIVARNWPESLPNILKHATGFDSRRLEVCLEFEMNRITDTDQYRIPDGLTDAQKMVLEHRRRGRAPDDDA